MTLGPSLGRAWEWTQWRGELFRREHRGLGLGRDPHENNMASPLIACVMVGACASNASVCTFRLSVHVLILLCTCVGGARRWLCGGSGGPWWGSGHSIGWCGVVSLVWATTGWPRGYCRIPMSSQSTQPKYWPLLSSSRPCRRNPPKCRTVLPVVKSGQHVWPRGPARTHAITFWRQWARMLFQSWRSLTYVLASAVASGTVSGPSILVRALRLQ
jgi:hypothetical protein